MIRVEVHHADDAPLRIDLLEVSHGSGRDRLLGRATTAADACRLLDDWLTTLATPP